MPRRSLRATGCVGRKKRHRGRLPQKMDVAGSLRSTLRQAALAGIVPATALPGEGVIDWMPSAPKRRTGWVVKLFFFLP